MSHDPNYYGFWTVALTVLVVVELARLFYAMKTYYGLRILNRNFVEWTEAWFAERDRRAS